MNATMIGQIRFPALENPFVLVLHWLLAAQARAEQGYQLAEMPLERLRDLGIDPKDIARETLRPILHA